MRLNEISFDAGLPVDGYGPGFFRVAGEVHHGAMLILPGGVSSWGGWEDTAAPLTGAGVIDLLLLGTGPDTAFAPPDFAAALEAAGILVEAMATPPACRSYNVLLSEGRRLGLAALPV